MSKLLLGLVAVTFLNCNKPTEAPEKVGENKTTNVGQIFPHSEQFKKTGLHGKSYVSDASTCLQCHGLDLKGGNSKISCTSCHSSFPHPSGWASPVVHGSSYLKLDDTKKAECMNCHSLKPESAIDAVTCVGCHAAFPHTDEFRAGEHGELARQYSGQCTSCHTDFKRHMPNAENGCLSCHSGNLKIQWLEESDKSKKTSAIFKKNQATQSSRVRN